MIGGCEAGRIVKRTDLDGDGFRMTLVACKQRCSAVGAKRSVNARSRIGGSIEDASVPFYGADRVSGNRDCHRRFATRHVLAVSTVTTHRDESVGVHFVSNLTAKTASRSFHGRLTSLASLCGVMDVPGLHGPCQ